MTSQNDDLLEQLAGLSVHDVDGWRKQRIRDRAHKLLKRQRRLGNVGKAYSRYLEPALVGSLAIGYLAWALQQVYFLKG